MRLNLYSKPGLVETASETTELQTRELSGFSPEREDSPVCPPLAPTATILTRRPAAPGAEIIAARRLRPGAEVLGYGAHGWMRRIVTGRASPPGTGPAEQEDRCATAAGEPGRGLRG